MAAITKVKSFPIPNDHMTVLGKTQHGKTWGTLHSLGRIKEGVIYFNTNHSQVTTAYTESSRGNTVDQLFNAVKKGRKINYVPSDRIEVQEKELAYIVDQLFKKDIKIRLAVDEVHLFRKEGLEAMRRIATAGLGREKKGVWISQRPANVHNDLITQSNVHVYYNMSGHDVAYCERYGIPAEEMQALVKAQKYVYATYNQEKVQGGFMIGTF